MLPKHYHVSDLVIFFLLLKRKLSATNRDFRWFAKVSEWIAKSWPYLNAHTCIVAVLLGMANSFSWWVDTLFALSILHNVDVEVLCYCHGNKVVIKQRLRYTQVPAMSIVGIIHMDAMQGKKGICFAQEKLILVVKSTKPKVLKSANKQNKTLQAQNRF